MQRNTNTNTIQSVITFSSEVFIPASQYPYALLSLERNVCERTRRVRIANVCGLTTNEVRNLSGKGVGCVSDIKNKERFSYNKDLVHNSISWSYHGKEPPVSAVVRFSLRFWLEHIILASITDPIRTPRLQHNYTSMFLTNRHVNWFSVIHKWKVSCPHNYPKECIARWKWETLSIKITSILTLLYTGELALKRVDLRNFTTTHPGHAPVDL